MQQDIQQIGSVLNRIRRVLYQDRTTIRQKMSDDQVKEALREAIQWTWAKNPELQQLADLAGEIERLEQTFSVVANNPIGLGRLAEAIRKEHEEKLKAFHDLLGRPAVKQNLEDLIDLIERSGKFLG